MAKQIWTGVGKDKNSRGLFLTVMLYITFFLAFVFLAWNIFAGILSPTVSDSEFRFALMMSALSIIYFVSVYGIWNLKKWGVVLNVITILGLISVDYFLTGKINTFAILLVLIPAILLYIAVFERWKLFR